jgi:hypothetical protein
MHTCGACGGYFAYPSKKSDFASRHNSLDAVTKLPLEVDAIRPDFPLFSGQYGQFWQSDQFSGATKSIS